MRARIAILSFGALAVLALGMRLGYVHNTLIVVDEFEHVHGAYLVSRGETPYVDFFEHHPPLFYYFAAPLIPASPSSETLIHARYTSLGAHAVAIVIGGLWMLSVHGRAAALLTSCLLLGNFFLFARGTLVYLDSYAIPLLLLAAWMLDGSRERPWRAFGCGLCLGLAVLITQKAAPALLAPLALFLAPAPPGSSPAGSRVRTLAAWVLGGSVACLLLPVLLGLAGCADFLRDAVVLNLHWKARHFPRKELAVLAISDGPIYLLAVIGLGRTLRDVLARRFALDRRDVPATFLAATALGVVLLPVVWEEYFILLVPFAVIVASLTLLDWWHAGVAGESRVVFLLPLALAGVALLDLIARRLAPTNRLSASALIATLGLWAVLGAVLVAMRARDGRATAPIWVALLLAFPLVEQADWIHHNSNREQRARVDYIVSTTGPSDRVLDGYSGWGVFRPHAYRYWFLHEEMQTMLSEDEMRSGVLRALEEHRPALVIVDGYLSALPSEVLAYVETHYVDTPYPGIKRRRDGPT